MAISFNARLNKLEKLVRPSEPSIVDMLKKRVAWEKAHPDEAKEEARKRAEEDAKLTPEERKARVRQLWEDLERAYRLRQQTKGY
jgi:hypothetical protein